MRFPTLLPSIVTGAKLVLNRPSERSTPIRVTLFFYKIEAQLWRQGSHGINYLSI